MILLTYIILGHPDWHGAEVSIFAAFPRAETQERTEELNEMIAEGRLLISEKNVLVIATDDGIDYERLVEARSATADLVVHGFTHAQLQRKGPALFERVPSLRDVLFVSAEEDIDID
jgi:pentose-5-phosphate-3-epimerase